jgi:hypothetical protein
MKGPQVATAKTESLLQILEDNYAKKSIIAHNFRYHRGLSEIVKLWMSGAVNTRSNA